MDGGNDNPTRLEMARAMLEDGADVHEVTRLTGISLSKAYEIRKEVREEKKLLKSWEFRRRVWTLFCDGLTPTEIDDGLGISDSRKVIAAEWRLDQLRKPSMVTEVGRKIEPPKD